MSLFSRPLILVLWLMILPWSLAAATILDLSLVFEVRNDQLDLNIWHRMNGQTYCPRSEEDGCLHLHKNTWAKIEFKLEDGDADCAEPESWRFKHVRLGGEGSFENPSPKPDDDEWGLLSPELASDFGADAESGVVTLDHYNKRTVRFNNRNQHRASLWYQDVVERCSVDENGHRETHAFHSQMFNGDNAHFHAPIN